MRVIQEAEAQDRWEVLLDDVERGQVYVITRDGRPIARLEPEVDKRQQDGSRAAAHAESAPLIGAP